MKNRHSIIGALWCVPFLPLWLLMWWYFVDTTSPLVSLSQTPNAQMLVVERPEGVNVSRKLCFSRAVWGTVSASYADGVLYHVPPFQVRFNEGCNSFSGILTVPHSLPPGIYKYKVSIDLDLNPISTAHVVLPDLTLDVRGASSQAEPQTADSAFPPTK